MFSRSLIRLLAVLAVVALVGAFAFSGFAAAEHRTTVDRQTATASTNGATMSVPPSLSLYVVGDDPTRERVETALVAELEKRGTAVDVVTEIAPDADQPVLLVAVPASRLGYSAVTASADVTLHFEYVASGNVTQFGTDGPGTEFDRSLLEQRLTNGTVVPLVLDDEDNFFRSGQVRLTDATTGLISWPGYRGYVFEKLVESTVSELLADTQ